MGVTNNERVPAGTADRLAAAVTRRKSNGFSAGDIRSDQFFTNGYNAARAACIDYLRSIEAAPLTARVAELEGALNHLLTVKEHKDKNGKDEWYEREQPIAWERANRAARTQNSAEQAESEPEPLAVCSRCNGRGAHGDGSDPAYNAVGQVNCTLYNGTGKLTAADAPISMPYCQPADQPHLPQADAPAQDAGIAERLDDLAQQLRTLQQDVAALKGGELREGEPCLTLADADARSVEHNRLTGIGPDGNPVTAYRSYRSNTHYRWQIRGLSGWSNTFDFPPDTCRWTHFHCKEGTIALLPQPAAPGVSK